MATKNLDSGQVNLYRLMYTFWSAGAYLGLGRLGCCLGR